MNDANEFTPVRKSVTVAVPRARAFDVFAGRIGEWWEASHSIGKAPQTGVTIEPFAGGRFYETCADGARLDWGRVLVWAPPERLVLAWQLTSEWRFDPGFETEVELRFVALGPDSPRVDLEHRSIERYGAAAEKVRASLDSPKGWGGLLARYSEAAAARR
jgi:uncharacterized protein YndB with AHSA1/START domain